jgi:hypothetical protein
MQWPGWGNQVILSGSNEVREGTFTWPENVPSLVWWLLIGVCVWHAPQLLASWLDVSSSGLFRHRTGSVLM